MAVVSCCETVMHAKCLSAWVNCDQQNPRNHHKAKICMKCRREVDIKHPLNEHVPKVSEKEWDEGYDFNAPDYVIAGQPKEFSITARSHRSHASMHRHRYTSFASLSAEQRKAITDAKAKFDNDMRAISQRREAARERSTLASHEAMEANRLMVEYQTHATQAEMDKLIAESQEARAKQERVRAEYERAQVEYEDARRVHMLQMSRVMERAHLESERAAIRARVAQEEAAARNAAAVPALRVVNGDAASSP
jgi:hypothetical protein